MTMNRKAAPGDSPIMQRIRRDVARLRPLPISLAQIVRALDDPTTSPQRLADLLNLDQSLTAEVLRDGQLGGDGLRAAQPDHAGSGDAAGLCPRKDDGAGGACQPAAEPVAGGLSAGRRGVVAPRDYHGDAGPHADAGAGVQ